MAGSFNNVAGDDRGIGRRPTAVIGIISPSRPLFRVVFSRKVFLDPDWTYDWCKWQPVADGFIIEGNRFDTLQSCINYIEYLRLVYKDELHKIKFAVLTPRGIMELYKPKANWLVEGF